MTVDIVNTENRKVGSVELKDEVFGGPVNNGLIWASVVHANAAERRGTHATKNRALVSGSGRKPWRQKGTGRARVGDIRNPLWRKGGTVFGPQPRSYDYQLPHKTELGALRAAIAQRAQDGALVIVDSLDVPDGKTKSAAELLNRLGASDKTLLVEVTPGEMLTRAVRNLPGVNLVTAGRVRARDVMNTTRVIASSAAIERLQEALVPGAGAKASARVDEASRSEPSEAPTKVAKKAARPRKQASAPKAHGTGRGRKA
ncbi:MAG TPA: 50S ribosomal protein L4 [Vicinamibacterales bacterium]|jgi:large subunit ribosomal protein L4